MRRQRTKASKTSLGIARFAGTFSHGAENTAAGTDLGLSLKFGVAPCQFLGSRNSAAPAGNGQSVLVRIHSGSSRSDGIGVWEC